MYCVIENILGWPKSSFGFLYHLRDKPERTFWPTQYVYKERERHIFLLTILHLRLFPHLSALLTSHSCYSFRKLCQAPLLSAPCALVIVTQLG